MLQDMSRLAEIESALETLPRREQQKLLLRLQARLKRSARNGTKPSLHDRMKDGCGIVDSGIRDLATNKTHMEGFGRSRV